MTHPDPRTIKEEEVTEAEKCTICGRIWHVKHECPPTKEVTTHCWHRSQLQHLTKFHECQVCCWCGAERCVRKNVVRSTQHGPHVTIWIKEEGEHISRFTGPDPCPNAPRESPQHGS